jgi:tetratricopeptide (TPR) repeat protein
MYWYPFREIAGVKNANLDAAVNLDVAGVNAKVGFYTTAVHPAATVKVTARGKALLEEKVAIGPAKPFTKTLAVPAGTDEHDVRASLSVNGKELVAYAPIRLKPIPMPNAVQGPPAPAQIKTNEELLLAGQRIEQFHNPNLDPLAYWQEALRRDPGDARVNIALGINFLKKARFADAEQHFRRAIERVADKFTTPKDAEAIYYLGLTLKAQGKNDEAYETLGKATWNMAWRDAAYFEMAELASQRANHAQALDLVERSLEANVLNLRALALKAALLRNTGQSQKALQVLATARRITDPLDVRLMAEQWLATKSAADRQPMASVFTRFPATASEVAAEYLHAGLWKDGTDVLLQADQTSPMPYYYLGYFAGKLNQQAKAAEFFARAARMSPEYVFPFQHEFVNVLRHAIEANASDARAPYYLGNLLYDWQPAEALKFWEKSAALDPSFAIVHRNLAVAYTHGAGTPQQAIAALEKAVGLDRKYAMHFKELDELYETAAAPLEKRLALVEQNHQVIAKRDDAVAREISLKVAAGKYDEAIALLSGRRFAVWEGTNLNVAEDWTSAHVLRGQQHVAAKRYKDALADFAKASEIPDNLPAGGRGGAGRSAEISYWTGVAHEGLGDQARAREAWTRAASPAPAPPTVGRGGGRGMARGGFQNAAQTYHRGLAMRRLGREEEARSAFEQLVKSAADSTQGHYSAALGYLGLGDMERARQELRRTLAANPAHLGARAALAGIGR